MAMDFNLFARDDVAAGMPYLFVMRLGISLANSKESRGRRQVGLFDASVAFFHAVNDEQLCITPPPGLRRPGYFWQLWKALYGTRRAAQLWQLYLGSMFESAQWVSIKCCPNMYYSHQLDVTTAIHGDDFIAEGEADSLDVLEELLKTWIEIKILGRLGPGASGGHRRGAARSDQARRRVSRAGSDPRRRTPRVEH